MILANQDQPSNNAEIDARALPSPLEQRPRRFPAVVLIGPRQVGTTTLARLLRTPEALHYLDRENPADLEKLADGQMTRDRCASLENRPPGNDRNDPLSRCQVIQ